MFNITEIMTTDVYTLSPDDTLQAARRLMAEHNIRHIPVVDDNRRLTGLLSQRDVLAGSESVLLSHSEDSESVESSTAISSLMTRNPITIEEDASLRGTALLMQGHRIGCLPVVRDGILVGIITDTDFVAVAINLIEQLELVEPVETDQQ